MEEEEVEVPQVDVMEDLDEPVETPALEPEPQKPREWTAQERKEAAMEYLRENPQALQEIAPTKAEAAQMPEFSSFEEVAQWAKAEAIKEIGQTMGVRAQVVAQVQADLDEFGDELTAKQRGEIVAMFNDPAASPQDVRAAYAQGVHKQYGKAAAWDNRKAGPRTSAEPTGGGSRPAASADVRRIQSDYERQTGVKLSTKDAEEYARSKN